MFLADKFKLRTVEVPVSGRMIHRSKINPLRDGIKMGLEVLGVRWNDMRELYRQPSAVLEEPCAEPVAPQVAE